MDFATVKLRLIGSIVAIAAIQILETFVHIDERQKPGRRLADLPSCSASAWSAYCWPLADRLSERHDRK